jgi:hypothetical protein
MDDIPHHLQRDEWLVGRGYLSAESISEVLGLGEQNSERPQTRKQRNLSQTDKEVAELQPA